MSSHTHTPSYYPLLTISSPSFYNYTPPQTHSTPLSPSSPSYENDSLYYYHSYAHTHHQPTCILSSPTSAPSTDILIITILTINSTTTAKLLIDQDVTCCTIYIKYYLCNYLYLHCFPARFVDIPYSSMYSY